MYFNSPASLQKTKLCQNYTETNGNGFCAPFNNGESSADEHETDGKMSKLGQVVTLHNCLNKLEKCTVQNCALNIFDNVVVKEELIIDDYEDSESVIANYYYDSFEKWSEFGQPLKTFLQNSNFKYHLEESYLPDKMHDDLISNNSSYYDDSLNSLGSSTDKSIVVRNQEWALEKVFKNESLVKAYLDQQNWSLRVRYNIQGGFRSLFRCNLVKNKMPQCAAKLSTEYSDVTKTFLVYNNRRKHTHGTILLDHSKSDPDVRQKVKELVDLGLSKYEIQLHLENNGYAMPSDNLVHKEREPVQKIESGFPRGVEIKPKMEQYYSKYDFSTTASKWILEKKFVSSKFALHYMKQTGLWSIFSKKRGHKTDKQYYRCNRVRKIGPQCAAQKYLLIDHTSGEAFLFGLNEHTHDSILANHNRQRNHNAFVKKEVDSEVENDENYQYFGYGNDDREMDETNDCSNSSATQNDLDRNVSQNGFNPSSSDTNKTKEFWILNRTFKTGAMAQLYLDQHKMWTIKDREVNAIGLKCNYRCGLVETNKLPQCAAMAYAQFHANNDKVFFYTNSRDHTHASINKGDQERKVHKLFRDHPKHNDLNSHMSNDLDIKEKNMDDKMNTPNDCNNLREAKSAPPQSSKSSNEIVKLFKQTSKKLILPWKFENKFDTYQDAVSYMEPKTNWYMWKKTDWKDGGSSKSYYKCTVKFRNKPCPAQKHIFDDRANDRISIYWCHNHSHKSDTPVSGSPVPFDEPNEEAAVVTNEDPLPPEPSNSESTQLSCSTKGTWGNNWELEMKFTKMSDALKYIKSKGIWSICGKLKVLSGYRQYYRCNLVTKSGPQCDARKYLFFNVPTTEVLLYGCNSHTHDMILSVMAQNDVDVTEENEEEKEERDTSVHASEDKRYTLDRKFKNLSAALSYLDEADTWTHHSTLKSLTGERRYYVCKLKGYKKQGYRKCGARCCLLLKKSKQEVCLYNRAHAHTHSLPLNQPEQKKTLKRKKGKSSYKSSCPTASKTFLQKNGTVRQINSWHLERYFINTEHALKYMKKQKIWSIFSKRRGNDDCNIQYYRCNKVRKMGPQCAAQKYLVFHHSRAKVALYGRNKHTHAVILGDESEEEVDNNVYNKDEVDKNEVDKDEVDKDEVDKDEVDKDEVDKDEVEKDEVDKVADAEPEIANEEETYEEPLNENLYAVDVVIEEVEAEEPIVPKNGMKPGRGLFKNYIFEKKFRNPRTALKYVKSQKIWSVSFTGKTSQGFRKRFRCNLVRGKGPQCAARKYLVYDVDPKKGVKLYKSIREHTHDLILSGVPEEEHSSGRLEDTLNKTEEFVEEPKELPVAPQKCRKTGKRMKWKRKSYNLERKFKNAQSAIKYMKSLKPNWSPYSKTSRKHEIKKYYRCNLVKPGGPQCKAGKFLLYTDLKKEVSLFYCDNHTHDEILEKYPTVGTIDNIEETNDESNDDEEP